MENASNNMLCGHFYELLQKMVRFLAKNTKAIYSYLCQGRESSPERDWRFQTSTPCIPFVTDANSIYNNIDTDHAIRVITWLLKDLSAKNNLPTNFPLNAVLNAMTIIMKNNIFEFGDCYFIQLLGTVMSTSAAVMWATLYYAYHEVHTIISKNGHNLLYFKRFIDDIFDIWTGNLTSDWDSFSEDINNFHVLKRDVNGVKTTTSVNFVDMTLSSENDRIISRTN